MDVDREDEENRKIVGQVSMARHPRFLKAAPCNMLLAFLAVPKLARQFASSNARNLIHVFEEIREGFTTFQNFKTGTGISSFRQVNGAADCASC